VSGFIDVEEAICEVLSEVAPTYTVSTEDTPRPYIQVNRTGGDQRPFEDSALVSVNVVAETRDESVELDRRVSNLLRDARGVATSVGFIDKITPSNAPAPLPYPVVSADREITSSWVVVSRLQ